MNRPYGIIGGVIITILYGVFYMQGVRLGFILRFVVIILAIYVFFTLISLQLDISRKMEDIERLRDEITVMTQENARLQDMLEAEIDDQLVAGIARDKLGYAMPGERFFEDISQK